jgi:poly-gamma-glutamate synthesis protein (capsule biosynthesis protein)
MANRLRHRLWLFFLVAVVEGIQPTPPGAEKPQSDLPVRFSASSSLASSSSLGPPDLQPLALADIFPPRDLSPLSLDPERIRVLVATGDICPARFTDVIIRSRGDDFSYPFAAVSHLLSDADLTVASLEAPLIEACPRRAPRFRFCGRPPFAQALRSAGIDVVTLESNHRGDYGPGGVRETVRHLKAKGLAVVDRDRSAILEIRGLRFGFLAFNGVGERIDRKMMQARIANLRPQVEVLIVSFHWGAEYVPLPQLAAGVAPDDPISVAHQAVEAGADLILGNHPHQVQAVELYRGKLIAYAHGNFIFDQMWSEETRTGVLGRYTFYDRSLVKAEYLPVRIENYAQPVPLAGRKAEAVLDRMRKASEELAGRIERGK